MSKISNIVTAIAVTPIFALTTVQAGALGQVGAGDIYRVRNVTTAANGSFSDTTTATCDQTVQFRVRIHNSGPETITNVTVKATLDGQKSTNHGSTVTISADNLVNGAAISDTAGVRTDKVTSISYVPGSTQLLGYSDNEGESPVIGSLADGITGNGINIGSVGPLTSDTRGVQFQAKLNCEVTPPVTTIQVCDLTTKKIVTINESDFNSSKYTRDLSKCNATPVTPATPTTLVKTGAGEVAAVFAAAAAFGVAAYSFVLRRRSTN